MPSSRIASMTLPTMSYAHVSPMHDTMMLIR